MAQAARIHDIRRVAICGAGPVGLAVAKYLLAEGHFSAVDIYEQQPNVGGAWLHTKPLAQEFFSVPQTDPFQPLQEPMNAETAPGSQPIFMTPMYDRLETNIPKELMQFSDFPFDEKLQLFPTREDVVQYIERYSADVRHLIRFETQVIKAEPLGTGKAGWQLTTKDLRTGKRDSHHYDALAVCSGHYTVPNIPSFTGIEKWNAHYPGNITHSKWYRAPSEYADKKVLVIGNAASGLDISFQISEVSRLPLLMSQRGPSLFSNPNSSSEEPHIKVLPEIAEFIDPADDERAVRFADGHVEKHVDAVLFATGYLYSFPFLPCAELDLLDDGMRVKHTYQHVIHTLHPSLAFFALPLKVLPFPLGEAQAAVVARIWSGRLELPQEAEMQKWEEETIEETGGGKGFHSLNYPNEFDYQRAMFDWASQATVGDGKLPVRFGERAAWTRQRFPAIKRAFAALGPARASVRTLEELGFDYEQWRREEGC